MNFQFTEGHKKVLARMFRRSIEILEIGRNTFPFGLFSGRVKYCQAGEHSFGTNKTFTGVAEKCRVIFSHCRGNK